MKFYTNVQLVGDNFLVRGYEKGNYFQTREKFSPTLFMKSPKSKSKYKTLSGEYVTVDAESEYTPMFGFTPAPDTHKHKATVLIREF